MTAAFKWDETESNLLYLKVHNWAVPSMSGPQPSVSGSLDCGWWEGAPGVRSQCTGQPRWTTYLIPLCALQDHSKSELEYRKWEKSFHARDLSHWHQNANNLNLRRKNLWWHPCQRETAGMRAAQRETRRKENIGWRTDEWPSALFAVLDVACEHKIVIIELS